MQKTLQTDNLKSQRCNKTSQTLITHSKIQDRQKVRGEGRSVLEYHKTFSFRAPLLRQQVSSLLHQGPNAEPETVEEGKVIVQFFGGGVTRVGVRPLVWREPVGGVSGTAFPLRAL